VAFEWLKEYVKYDNVLIGANSKYLIEALEPLLKTNVVYMPNYYKVTNKEICKKTLDNKIVNIGIFGAIRPMKNTLTQAIAAINYAEMENKKLYLHVNSARIEQKGDNALKNLRALFTDSKHELVEHGWLAHGDFVKLVGTMDLCLQISLTETYNIVAADAINQEVPVVTSDEIPFVNYFSNVSSNKDVVNIVDVIKFNFFFKNILTKFNKFLLSLDSKKAEKVWLKIFK
jgi:hypothetical protein